MPVSAQSTLDRTNEEQTSVMSLLLGPIDLEPDWSLDGGDLHISDLPLVTVFIQQRVEQTVECDLTGTTN